MTTWKLTAAQKAEAVGQYEAGRSAPQIAAEFGVAPQSIWRLLRRRGVAMRTSREANARHSLKHDAFDVLTPGTAYWCGFIFADGTVSTRPYRTAEVAVQLAERDRSHLEKLRIFLGSTHTISAKLPHRYGDYITAPCCALSVRSDQLATRLLKLGRYGPVIDPVLAASRDFWRGVVDGDGYIGISRNYAQFHLVGSQWLMLAFADFLRATGLCSLSVRPHRTIYEVGTTGSSAERITELLYGGAATALDRKAAAAVRILAAAAARVPKTQCGNGHEINEVNTYAASSGRWVCRPCNRAKCRRYRARKSAESAHALAEITGWARRRELTAQGAGAR